MSERSALYDQVASEYGTPVADAVDEVLGERLAELLAREQLLHVRTVERNKLSSHVGRLRIALIRRVQTCQAAAEPCRLCAADQPLLAETARWALDDEEIVT